MVELADATGVRLTIRLAAGQPLDVAATHEPSNGYDTFAGLNFLFFEVPRAGDGADTQTKNKKINLKDRPG